MKKITLLSMCLLISGFIGVVNGQNRSSTIQASATKHLGFNYQNPNFENNFSSAVACDGVLADYTNSLGTTNGGPSQDFEAANDFYDSQLADDFVMPLGNNTICKIDITGSGPGLPTNPANNVILRIYDDAAGLPGSLVFTEVFLGSDVDGDGDGSFSLSPTGLPSLTGGATYWVSVQAQMEFANGGQWFWTTATDGHGNPFVFRNPGDGFGTGCTGWATGCNVAGGSGPDLLMNISFNDLSSPVTYCTASGNNTTYENITNVTYAGINNTTTTHSGYNDFTAQVANVRQGDTEQISVTIKADGSDYVYAFIDWDQNGVLDDAGEVYILASSTSSAGPHTMNINVPASADLGTTRMRVKVGWLQSTPNPCGTFSYGEIEDYTVNVQTPAIGNPPVIACPTDIVVNNAPETCGASVNFAGVAFDDEDGNISGDITATPASGSVFPVGDTTVTLSVTDSDGNTTTCQFTVTVVDNELPIAVCQNVTVDLDSVTGTATITSADVDNGSSDNCGIASIALSKSTFSCSDIGENTVTVTVTDNSGNIATCTTIVTIQDTTAPEIFCVGGFGTFTESEDFEGPTVPAGWTTNIVSGGFDWSFGSGVMPTGGDFPTNAAIFDDDAAGSGGLNVAELISPTYDLTGATEAKISFDYALQDFAGSGLLRTEVWDGSAWQEIFLVDDQDVPPANSGDIDVLAYANADFQVKYTFDDEGDWGWGAGVDNFLLTYEASSGGGLDVYLDADGLAVVVGNDLLTGVNEACGYTISIGGSGGGTTGSISTAFDSNNGGSAGWIQFFDITVGPNDIDITDLDVNTSGTSAINLEMYTLVGTSVGNQLDAAAWGAPTTTGTGTGAGQDLPSNITLASPVTLTAGTTYGIALSMDSSPRYTNGTGCPGNECYSNADLSLALGSVVSGQFTGSLFTPRIFNGTINYTSGPAASIEFTCADLGENMVEVTVTDDSGNTATCMAIVNVIDNIAPVITCGNTQVTSITEDFESASIPSGWSTDITAGTEDWAFGSGVMPTGDDFPTNAAIFNDDAAGSSAINASALLSPVYDLTDATNIMVGYDVAFQESGNQELKVEVYDGAAWQQIAFYDQDLSPNIQTESIDVSAYVNADFQVRFAYDDLAGWGWGAGVDNFTLDYEIASTDPIEIALGADGTTTIDPYDLISEIDEACGISTVAVDVPTVTCADIGAPISVTVFVSDASGNIASCVAIINVVDTMAPDITCPADQTVDPGAGNLFYILPDYFATGEASAMDNCTDPVTITTQDPAVGAALPDGVHTITLTATDEYGNTATCSFELTVDTIVGIAENSLDIGLTLYPNPASQVVNLVNKTNISLEKMMIYDINGKLVSQTNLRTMQGEKAVDVSSLASGVYVVQIIGDNASTVKRLIKK